MRRYQSIKPTAPETQRALAQSKESDAARSLPVSAQVRDVSDDGAPLLTIEELSRRSRLSIATLHRLKKAGRIAFFQPAGKGGRVLFPADAIERTGDLRSPAAETGHDDNSGDQCLSGPRPAWMR